jgi:hypothetical protein
MLYFEHVSGTQGKQVLLNVYTFLSLHFKQVIGFD